MNESNIVLEKLPIGEKLKPGMHTISRSKDGRRKMVVRITSLGKGKMESATKHLHKVNGGWVDHSHKNI